MLDKMLIKNMYTLEETIAAEIFEGLNYPWEALPLIKDFILKLGPTLDKEIYEEVKENV